MTKKRIETNGAPAAIGPYCQAVAIGEWVYCSGQVALDPDADDPLLASMAFEGEETR